MEGEPANYFVEFRELQLRKKKSDSRKQMNDLRYFKKSVVNYYLGESYFGTHIESSSL